MDPINYTIAVKDPFESYAKGFAFGDAMQKKSAQEAMQMQMQQDLAALASNPNAGAKDYAAAMVKYPQISEHFKRSWDVLSADQQQTRLSQTSQVYSALLAGKPDVAIGMLDKQAEAYRNSGMAQQAQYAETASRLIRDLPNVAETTAALDLSAILGPAKFAESFSTLLAAKRAEEKQPAEMAKSVAEARIKQAEAATTPERLGLENMYKAGQIREIDSQIADRASRLTLDRDKLQSDVEMKIYELGQKGGGLDDSAKKIVNDSTVASVSADQSAAQMLDLANRLEGQGGYGAFSTANEFLKKATGNQDALSQMRQEYIRLRNNQAIKMLPPGPATDKDIQIAMQGFPAETADASVMTSFLRGMAKLQQVTAANETAKAEWVNAVGHLGKPKSDISIDGVQVPAGTTFTDFSRQFIEGMAGRRAAQQERASIPSRSYQRWAK